MTPERSAYLIKRVNKGVAPDAEKNELDDFWKTASTDEAVIHNMNEQERESLRASIFMSVMSSVRKDESTAAHGRRRFLQSVILWRVAASLLIATLAAFWFYDSDNFLEEQTAYGETQEIILPDGSQLMLNANSSVRFKDHWTESGDREVWIKGEGFFDVRHTANHQKFIVHTDQQLDVQVLGTRFNVKVRRARTEVMLEEGKVNVNLTNEDGGTRTLEPGDLVSLENNKLSGGEVNPSRYASWKDSKLYFDETPLVEVAKMLEDTFGYHIAFGTRSAMDRKLSGELRSGSAEDIIQAIEESLQIRMIKDKQNIIFN
ncbi:MAG TPA: FecR domain-containing protein [Chryseolinea sp.]|nr:FecR domain-containing protein [Chryseolinea sp.]